MGMGPGMLVLQLLKMLKAIIMSDIILLLK